jgi:uncharacterized protein YbjT (DUF2867 family)
VGEAKARERSSNGLREHRDILIVVSGSGPPATPISNPAKMDDNDLRHVGRTLRIGPKVVISVLERDPRCAMITIGPDTAAHNTAILGRVTKAHDGKAGVYGAVLVEGVVRVGDDIEVANWTR